MGHPTLEVQPSPLFMDVTQQAGITFQHHPEPGSADTGFGAGALALDFNGDLWDDVYVTNSKSDARWAAENFRYTARAARSLRFDYVELEDTTIKDLSFEGEPSLDDIIENGIIGDAETCAEKIVDEMSRARLSHYACLIGVGAMDQHKVMSSLEKTNVFHLI